MSTSNLYILNRRSATHFKEFGNGWGSAPRCWDYLSKKYLGIPSAMHDMEAMQKVWALADSNVISREENIALRFTFDKAFIPVANLADAAEAIEKFGQLCENSTSVNHWPAIAVALREASKIKHHHEARGICLSPTSVSDNWHSSNREWLADAWSIYEDLK